MKNIPYYLLVFSFFTGLSACQSEEDFLDKVNPNEVTTETFFETAGDAITAINGAYSPLQSGNLYHNSYFNMLDVGIEMLPNSNMPGSWHISTYSFDATHETPGNVWRGLYQIIGRANFAIQNIQEMENLEGALKNRLLGEAHFLRGWAYFELAFFWGRVPIFLQLPTNSEETNQPRAESELAVYQQAISDFEFAADNLPVVYEDPADVGRATKGAAVGYLGKVHLYLASPGVDLMSDGYQKAEQYFSQLVNSGEYDYALMDDYVDNFTWFAENNQESLFEIQFTDVGGNPFGWSDHDFASVAEGTNRARTFGYLTWFNAYMNPSFVERFSDEDPRLRLTAYGPPTPAHPEPMTVFDGLAYDREDWVSRKYGRYDYIPASQENGDSPINFRVMRYADVLLMYAEALNEQGKTAEAIQYLNQVRQRPSTDLPSLSTSLSQSEAREAIRSERLWELGLEQSRMKDALRWGAAFAEQEYDIAGIETFDYGVHRYMPIPQQEIDRNQALTNADQNPGY
jgi:tetratricopeptide (TPR) repeat protein